MPIDRDSNNVINKIRVLCFGTAMLERAPCRRQDRRVAHQPLQETPYSLVVISPGLCITSPQRPFPSRILLKTAFSRTYCILYILVVHVCMLHVVRPGT